MADPKYTNQVHFGIGDNDNADPDGCSFDTTDAQRTGYTSGAIMVRVSVENTGGKDTGVVAWRLHYNKVNSFATATQITTVSTNAFKMASGLPGNQDPTNAMVLGGTGTRQDGYYTEATSTESTAVKIPNAYYMEMQFCIEAGSGLEGNTDYYFFISEAGTSLDNYAQNLAIQTGSLAIQVPLDAGSLTLGQEFLGEAFGLQSKAVVLTGKSVATFYATVVQLAAVALTMTGQSFSTVMTYLFTFVSGALRFAGQVLNPVFFYDGDIEFVDTDGYTWRPHAEVAGAEQFMFVATSLSIAGKFIGEQFGLQRGTATYVGKYLGERFLTLAGGLSLVGRQTNEVFRLISGTISITGEFLSESFELIKGSINLVGKRIDEAFGLIKSSLSFVGKNLTILGDIQLMLDAASLALTGRYLGENFKFVKGTLSISGKLLDEIFRLVSNSLTLGGSFLAERFGLVASSLAFVGKDFSALISGAVNMLAGALTATGSFINERFTILAGSSVFTGKTVGEIVKLLKGTVSISGSLVNEAFGLVNGALTLAGQTLTILEAGAVMMAAGVLTFSPKTFGEGFRMVASSLTFVGKVLLWGQVVWKDGDIVFTDGDIIFVPKEGAVEVRLASVALVVAGKQLNERFTVLKGTLTLTGKNIITGSEILVELATVALSFVGSNIIELFRLKSVALSFVGKLVNAAETFLLKVQSLTFTGKAITATIVGRLVAGALVISGARVNEAFTLSRGTLTLTGRTLYFFAETILVLGASALTLTGYDIISLLDQILVLVKGTLTFGGKAFSEPGEYIKRMRDWFWEFIE